MLVVQMHGEPGSGKSTVARALGQKLGAVVLDKDVIKSALLGGGMAPDEAGSAAYEVYFAMALAVAQQRFPLILDNPVFWPRVEEQWLRVAGYAGSPAVLLACVCADRQELERRLAARPALLSQPRVPLDLTRHPGSAATAFEPRLVLDTTRPLDELIEDALAYINAQMHAGVGPAAGGVR